MSTWKWAEGLLLALPAAVGLGAAYVFRARNNPVSAIELVGWFGIAIAGGSLFGVLSWWVLR